MRHWRITTADWFFTDCTVPSLRGNELRRRRLPHEWVNTITDDKNLSLDFHLILNIS